MPLNKSQIDDLLRRIALTTVTEINCDECLALMPEYAEATVSQQPIVGELVLVEVHLVQCPCCKEEFEIIVAAIRVID